MSKMNLVVLPLALLVSGAVNAATVNPYYVGARAGGVHYADFDAKTGNDHWNPSQVTSIDRDDLAGWYFSWVTM